MTSYPITIITVLPVQILMYGFLGEFNVTLLKEAEISRMCLTKLVQFSLFFSLFLCGDQITPQLNP